MIFKEKMETATILLVLILSRIVEGGGVDSATSLDIDGSKGSTKINKVNEDIENVTHRLIREDYESHVEEHKVGKRIKDNLEVLLKTSDEGESTSSEIVSSTKRLLLPLEDQESSSAESRSHNKHRGNAFFVADDGKKIQLPQNDVVYNTETGELLIKNRHHSTNSAESSTERLSRTKGYYNIRPSGLGIKNLQGFFIADTGGNMNMPFLYPLTADLSVETTRSEGVTKSMDKVKKERRDSDEVTTGDDKLVGKVKNDDFNQYNEDDMREETLEDDVSEDKVTKALLEKVRDELDHVTTTHGHRKTTESYILQDTSKMSSVVYPDEYVTPAYEQTTRQAQQDSERTSEETKTKETSHAPTTGHERTERKNAQIKHVLDDFHVLGNRRNKYSDDENRKHDKEAVEDSAAVFSQISHEVVTTESTTKTAHKLNSIRTKANDDEDESPSTDRKTTSTYKSYTEKSTTERVELELPEHRVTQDELLQTSIKNDENNSIKAEVDEANDLKDEEDHFKEEENLAPVEDSPEEVEEAVHVVSIPVTTPAADTLEVLRSYLDDMYVRAPIAIVVDVEERNLNLTRLAWRSMEAEGGRFNSTDVVLIGYDKNGVTWTSHHKLSSPQRGAAEARAFRKALNGLRTTSKVRGDAIAALSAAGRVLPYDSAAFLFGEGRADGKQSEAKTLLEVLLNKRIKLYAISSGDEWITSAAVVTGGSSVRVLGRHRTVLGALLEHARDSRALDVYYDEEEELDFDEEQTLVQRNSLSGAQALSIPIDSSIKTLTVSITGSPDLTVLYGPEGSRIDLLDPSSVEAFTSGSTVLSGLPSPSARLVMPQNTHHHPFTHSEEYQGVWTLMVHGNGTVPYGIRVSAETGVMFMAKLFTKTDGGKTIPMLKLAVNGAVHAVTEGALLDDQGNKLHAIPYRFKDAVDDVSDVETQRALESGTVISEAELPAGVKGSGIRVQVTGRNDRDEPFIRLSQPLIIPDMEPPTPTSQFEVETAPASGVVVPAGSSPSRLELLEESTPRDNQGARALGTEAVTLGRGLDSLEGGKNNANMTNQAQIATEYVLPLSVVQIGAASKLHGAPGQQIQLHFEVTNNRESSVYFRFGVKDDQYFLRSMVPQRQWINGGQTLNVIVTVGITSTAENNVRDTIQFTASGLDQSTINAYVYVETDGRISSDKSRPYLRHEYRGDCMGYLGSDCAARNWALDITARDTESGLMRIGVSPGSLVYQAGFFAGSREEARARFTASCCTPNVVISASDLNGNVASYEVNVAQYLTPATIAAICLGVLLFIVLVILVILGIRACVRRRSASRDLPSYQSRTT